MGVRGQKNYFLIFCRSHGVEWHAKNRIKKYYFYHAGEYFENQVLPVITIAAQTLTVNISKSTFGTSTLETIHNYVLVLCQDVLQIIPLRFDVAILKILNFSDFMLLFMCLGRAKKGHFWGFLCLKNVVIKIKRIPTSLLKGHSLGTYPRNFRSIEWAVFKVEVPKGQIFHYEKITF